MHMSRVNFNKQYKDLLLKNINLILAFNINIISQAIEHLNISSAFIVYTAIKLNFLLVARVAQWVEHVNIIVIFKLCVVTVVRIPKAIFIIVTIENTFVFIFIKFSFFCNILSPFYLI